MYYIYIYIYILYIYMYIYSILLLLYISILPKVEPCTTCNLNELVPCSKRILILYDFQNEICTKKYCELIKAVPEIFSL